LRVDLATMAVAAVYAGFFTVPALLAACVVRRDFAWLPLGVLVVLVLLTDGWLARGAAFDADAANITLQTFTGMALGNVCGVLAAAVALLALRALWPVVRSHALPGRHKAA
jgi:hypothetical protein